MLSNCSVDVSKFLCDESTSLCCCGLIFSLLHRRGVRPFPDFPKSAIALTFRRWTISRGNCAPSEGGNGQNGRETRIRTFWRAWHENSPSEGGTISRGYCAPSEGGNGQNGRETRIRTLWRVWHENSPSEGGTISRENCSSSEGGMCDQFTVSSVSLTQRT